MLLSSRLVATPEQAAPGSLQQEYRAPVFWQTSYLCWCLFCCSDNDSTLRSRCAAAVGVIVYFAEKSTHFLPRPSRSQYSQWGTPRNCSSKRLYKSLRYHTVSASFTKTCLHSPGQCKLHITFKKTLHVYSCFLALLYIHTRLRSSYHSRLDWVAERETKMRPTFKTCATTYLRSLGQFPIADIH